MSKAGFTVLELLVALGLGGVLLAAGALGLTALVAHVRLAGAAEALASALRSARVEALARHETLVVRFDRRGTGWAVESSRGTPLGSGLVPAGVTITETPVRGRIHFGPLGVADNASVRLVAGRSERLVVVSQRGRVRSR